MRALLKAGLTAAIRQLMTVVLITLLALVVGPPGDDGIIISKAEQSAAKIQTSIASFLTWTFVILAIGWTLTIGKSIDNTAKHMRRTVMAMRVSRPEHILTILATQLSLAGMDVADRSADNAYQVHILNVLRQTRAPAINMARREG